MPAEVLFRSFLTQITTERLDPLGSIRFESGKAYKYVLIRNTTATVAGAAGNVVAYEAEDGYTNSVVVIDRTDADTKAIGAGVLLGSVAGVHSPQVEYYGWIQLTGPATVTETLGGSAGDGDTLMAGTTDKALTKFTNDDGHPCAVAIDATAKTIACQFPF